MENKLYVYKSYKNVNNGNFYTLGKFNNMLVCLNGFRVESFFNNKRTDCHNLNLLDKETVTEILERLNSFVKYTKDYPFTRKNLFIKTHFEVEVYNDYNNNLLNIYNRYLIKNKKDGLLIDMCRSGYDTDTPVRFKAIETNDYCGNKNHDYFSVWGNQDYINLVNLLNAYISDDDESFIDYIFYKNQIEVSANGKKVLISTESAKNLGLL